MLFSPLALPLPTTRPSRFRKGLAGLCLCLFFSLVLPGPDQYGSARGQLPTCLHAALKTCLPGSASAIAGERRRAKNQVRKAARHKLSRKYALRKRRSTGKQPRVNLALQPPLRGSISSPFGIRKAPFRRGYRMHKGLDIQARIGTPICAAEDGFICTAHRQGAYGLCVEIDHGKGLSTKYAHMKRICVRPGQHVEQGDIIGYVGMTGRTTGPHLHFEVLRNDVPMNPLPLLEH